MDAQIAIAVRREQKTAVPKGVKVTRGVAVGRVRAGCKCLIKAKRCAKQANERRGNDGNDAKQPPLT